jgi:glycosyltransferase involved in cell wall biosynthesis
MKRIAFVVQRVSHFEVPLLRMYAIKCGPSFCVFYTKKPHSASTSIDRFHKAPADWGDETLHGFESRFCADNTALLSELWAFNPDHTVIYGYNWLGALLAVTMLRLLGRETVYRGTITTVARPDETFLSRGWRKIRPLILRLFTKFQFGGVYSSGVLTAARVKKDRQFFVPYGVNDEYFLETGHDIDAKALSLRLKWRADSRDFIVLFVGYLDYYKGPDVALEAFIFAIERGFRGQLVFVGGGEYLDKLRARAQDAGVGDRTHFEGFKPSPSVRYYYHAANVGLFPSRYDTWGRSVNEAMLCGLPVIGTHQLGCSPDLLPTAGWIAENGAAETLGNLLLEVSKLSKAELATKSMLAREVAIRYTYLSNQEAALRSVGW